MPGSGVQYCRQTGQILHDVPERLIEGDVFGISTPDDIAGQHLADFGDDVVIVDQAGFLLAFARADGAPFRSIAISEGKAYSAARMGVTTQAFFERCKKEEISPIDFCDAKLTKLAGGAPLKNSAGKLLGAAGVSGLTSAQDQEIVDLLAVEVSKL